MKRFLLIIFSFLIYSFLLGQDMEYQHSPYYSFVENKGQWPEGVLFQSRVENGKLWIEEDGLLFHLQDYSLLEETHFSSKPTPDIITFREKLVAVKFLGAKTISSIEKQGKTPYFYNYFIGNDAQRWASEVRGYEEIKLNELYEGIDIHFIEQEKLLKYEFIVQPYADPQQIKIQYRFADKLKITKNGDLLIQTELGEILEKAPYTYQIVNGKIVEIPTRYKLDGEIVTFEIGAYQERAELIIDPTLVFATYCGAVSDNFGMTATYGYDGSAFTAGTIYGNSYPMPDVNAYNTTSNFTTVNVGVVTTDAFITKYSADGTTMLWSTFYGGGDNTQGTDVPHSLICDGEDNVYIFGTTSATDFPTTTNAFQSTFGGGTPIAINYNGTNFGTAGTDIYVAKFSANGHNLLGSTYVGGDQNDGVNYIISAGNYNTASRYDSLTMNYGDQFRGEIMLDKDHNVIVGSCSRSANFPTEKAFQNTLGGQQDGVIFKLKNDFTEMLFSSYYGGTQADAIYSVKVDSSYNIVFGGGTTSVDLDITPGAYQTTNLGGKAEGFIGKLTPDGQVLSHSTYLGTSDYDQVFFIEIDRADRIFAFGQSNGGNFPVINANYSVPNSSQFIARLDENLSTIEASTIFGSGNPKFDISPSAFLVDICGNMYISGWGGSVLQGAPPMNGMPITPNAFLSTPPNGFDFYLMVIEREFEGLLYGTYMGGSASSEHVDGGTSRFDKNGVVYQAVCGGCGGNSDFPTTSGAWSGQNLANNCNALIFKFDFNLIPHAEFTADNVIGCTPFTVKFDNFSSDSDSYYWDFGDGNVDSLTFEPEITYTEPGNYEVWLYVTDSICLLTDSAKLTIQVYPELHLEPFTSIDLCEPTPISFTADSKGTATTFIWSSNASFSDTLNSSISDSIVNIQNPVDGYYYIKISNNGCSLVDSVEVTFTSANLNLSGETHLCIGDETEITVASDHPNITFSNYSWSADSVIINGQGTNTIVANPTVTQYIIVTAQASNGCLISDSILVLVSDIDLTQVSASASEEDVPIGEEVILTAEPSGYSYTWVPQENIENPNSQETVAVVYETTDYVVQISDGICTKTASVKVKAFPYVCDEPYIYVPNAFTPNGDGENDVLFVRSRIVSEVIFRVYDRWGEKVFETTDMSQGWDGTLKGKDLKPDVYDYYVKGQCVDNQEFLIKGNVTLIR